MRKIGLYLLGLLVLSLLLLGVVLPVLADDGPIDVQVDRAGMDPRVGPVDPEFRTDGVFASPQSRDALDYNTEGNGPTNGNYSNIPGGGTGKGSGNSSDGKTNWWKDHGKGLLLGTLEGIGIAVGVVAVGALFAISSPVIAAAALGAVIGTAAYGAIAGASNYNPWEAAVNGLIGAVSGGIGAGLGAMSAGVKTLVIGAMDVVGSGIASAASYGLNTSSPTTEGYLSSFGIGAAIGGATLGLGRLASMTGIGQRVSGLLRGRVAREMVDDLHEITPRLGDTVVGTAAKEERLAAQMAAQTNPQVANRLVGVAGHGSQERVAAEITESSRVIKRGPTVRPSWRDSEVSVGEDLVGQGYAPQKSYKNGVEVPYGSKGSSRPEFYKAGSSVEVKNYNVVTTEGRSRLIRNVSAQARTRVANLPPGTVQSVVIDIRGQTASEDTLQALAQRISEESGGAVLPANIIFKR